MPIAEDLGPHLLAYPPDLPKGRKAQRFANARLDIYTRGAVVTSGEGATFAFPWETIRVVQSITNVVGTFDRHTNYSYVLANPQGEAVYIGNTTGGSGSLGRHLGIPKSKIVLVGEFADAETWGPCIQGEMVAAQLPAACEAIRGGGALGFGEWTLNREGIAFKGTFIAWERIQQVRLAVGYLVVLADGKKKSAVKELFLVIPNVHLLVGIAERALNGSL